MDRSQKGGGYQRTEILPRLALDRKNGKDGFDGNDLKEFYANE